MKATLYILIIAAVLALLAACAPHQKPEVGKMTGDKLAAFLVKIAKHAQIEGNVVSFKIKEREMVLVYDPNADRMRLMSPIAPAGSASEDVYTRMLQANYDAVLDPRYAIANDLIWAAFIHPLSNLTENDFISSVVQSYTAAETFGSSYSSGAFVYGGGDSNALHEELLEDLEKATQSKGKYI